MGNHSVSAAKAVQAVASTKNGEDRFSQRPGMCEKPRGRAGRKKILELLERTIGNDGNHFDEALSLFHDLSYRQKLNIMRKMERRLMEVRGYAFSNEDNTRTVHVIADFFFKVAQYIPTNEEGEKVIKPIKGATKTLENIASQTEYDDEPYSQMRIACLRALWDLDCGNYRFWEGQLIGDGTNKETEDFVITKLLEHEAENFKDHGWSMLMRDLEKLSTAIARNTSPKKVDFLRLMLKDSNSEVVSSALEASLYLESIPEDFIKAAHEMSQNGENETEQETSGLMQELDDVLYNTRKKVELGKRADDFLRIAHLKDQLREDGDARFEATLELIQIFNSGVPHLSDLLKQTGDEMAGMVEEPASKTEKQQWEQQKKALNALLCLSDVGINDPLQSVVDNLLEAEVKNSQEFLREYLGVLGGFVACSPSTKKVGFLKEMVMDEQPEVGLSAFATVASSSSLHQEFIDLAYEMLEDDKKQQLWGPIHNFLHTAHTTMATGGSWNGTYPLAMIVLHESAESSEKIETIKALLKSENPHKARHGFAAASYLKEIPKDLIDLAYGMLGDDKKKHLREGIHNFLHTVHISTARIYPAPPVVIFCNFTRYRLREL